jgi:hypothetical protein
MKRSCTMTSLRTCATASSSCTGPRHQKRQSHRVGAHCKTHCLCRSASDKARLVRDPNLSIPANRPDYTNITYGLSRTAKTYYVRQEGAGRDLGPTSSDLGNKWARDASCPYNAIAASALKGSRSTP